MPRGSSSVTVTEMIEKLNALTITAATATVDEHCTALFNRIGCGKEH